MAIALEYVFEIPQPAVDFEFSIPEKINFDFEIENITLQLGGGTVDIIDQNSNVIDTVAAGDSYQVEVLEEIVDDEDLNTATIIDPLQ